MEKLLAFAWGFRFCTAARSFERGKACVKNNGVVHLFHYLFRPFLRSKLSTPEKQDIVLILS